MSPEELLEAGVLIYLRGLGFPTDRRPSAKDQPSQPPGRRRFHLPVLGALPNNFWGAAAARLTKTGMV